MDCIRCRVKKGWNEAGRLGTLFFDGVINGRHWAIVLWDGDEEPELNKAEGVEVVGWKTLIPIAKGA